jgi:lysozyme
MLISQKAIELIKKFEGCSLKPYCCPAGYPTIGYGHKIAKNENYAEISCNMAHDLLLIDLVKVQFSVLNNIYYPLNQNQFSAIVSFTYNVGGAALQRSTLRQKINYGSLEEVELEMLKWVYVKGQKIAGLIKRRQTEIELFYQC